MNNINDYSYSGWSFTSIKSMISSTDEIDKLSHNLGFPMPNMIFGKNKVCIRNGKNFQLEFNARDALSLVEKSVKFEVANSQEWKEKSQHSKELETIKPFDWTFSSAYLGTINDEIISNEMQDFGEITSESPDIELLKKPDPILYYCENILFEDELADNGISQMSIKMRVMPQFFLCLLRFHLVIENVIVRVLETRIFHYFGSNCLLIHFQEKQEDYKILKTSPEVNLYSEVVWQNVPCIKETKRKFIIN
jgi:type 2A phosphatase activator TIP41